jgi:Ca-activated chloride channel homolog
VKFLEESGAGEEAEVYGMCKHWRQKRLPDEATRDKELMSTRPLLFALFALAAESVGAQGWIVPRPCAPPPRCRDERCVQPLPCAPATPAVERTSSQVVVDLSDRVLRYEVSETFVNRGGRVAEADYMFPLPKGAAFQDLALSINGEMVTGETMNAEKARGIYEEIVRKSRDPALVEWMGYGLLRTRIFPINPGEEKRVVVRFQTVAEREGDAMRIDYERPRPPQAGAGAVRPEFRLIDESERDANRERGPVNTFALRYQRETRYGEPYSPTHRLRTRERGDRNVVSASGDAPQVTILLPVRRANAAAVAVLSHRPSNEDGFALITVSPPAVAPRRTPRDVTLVLDVSGSMRGQKMDQARAAGRQVLGSLSSDDRFRIIDFSTDVRTFREEFVNATSTNLASARRYLEALQAEGSTNISGALDDALDAPVASGRLPLVLFITDGEPTVGERNPATIAASASRRRGERRVFTFGVGADVNAALVEQLAVEGQGTAHFVRPEESVERAVALLADRLTTPLLTDVRVRADGIRLVQTLPAGAQDIFAGQDLVLLARYEGSGDARLIVEARSANGPVSWSSDVQFPDRERDNPFVARLWATQRIGWLSAERRRSGGNAELDGEIKDLGLRYGIPTEFSSYLVVEPGMNVVMSRDRTANAIPAPTLARAAAGAASAPASPTIAFEAAKQASARREARSLVDAELTSAVERDASGAPMRRIEHRIFRQVSGVWTDTRYVATMRTIKVKAYSTAYFDLLGKLESLRAPFALGDRVIVAGKSVAIEVAADGKETLGADELANIERAW